MAIIALNAAQRMDDNGLSPAQQSGLTATDSYTFPNDGKTFLLVKHGAGAANATFVTPGTYRGKAIADNVVALTVSGDKLIGPFPPDLYNDSGGLVSVSFSEATGLTVAVVNFP
jgi:hypothetical protein